MPIEAVTQTQLGPCYILSGNDDLHVGAGVVLQTTYTDPASGTGADCIISWIGTHAITVEGTVIGADEAINLVGVETAQTVIVGATGHLISGGDGVVTDADGVILDGLNSSLSNAGLIEAYGSGASVIVRDGGTTTVSNSGTITANIAGVWHKFGNGTLVFSNSGLVDSAGDAYRGGSSVDQVINSGTLRGDVLLAGGDDLYDGRGGFVAGAIDGGEGDDRFILSNRKETVDGGLGSDTLDLAHATVKLTVNLANAALNRGAPVAGDSLSGFENVTGGSNADRLTGDGQDNLLIGNAGQDSLAGGSGDDWLEGGTQRDTLTGGDGADDFVFLTRLSAGDIITDFSHGSDRIVLEGAAFGQGQATGALAAGHFVSGANPVALDGDDRLLFRTGDATLWYDPDGSGAKAAVLLADLQAGAVLTAADIWLV